MSERNKCPRCGGAMNAWSVLMKWGECEKCHGEGLASFMLDLVEEATPLDSGRFEWFTDDGLPGFERLVLTHNGEGHIRTIIVPDKFDRLDDEGDDENRVVYVFVKLPGEAEFLEHEKSVTETVAELIVNSWMETIGDVKGARHV